MKIKNLYLLLFFLCIANVEIFAQYIPKGMNYQAVARDEKGYELKNKELEVRISIIANESSGPVEYTESHSPTTDKYGLFSLVIGQGSFVSGLVSDFSEINWGSGVHFLKVEVDFGAGLKSMGLTQLLAVPYALYSGTSANVPLDDQKLAYDPLKRELSLEDGGKVDLTGLYKDSDADSTNELQYLSWNGQALSISGRNSITLTDLINDADADSTNEIQDLTLDEGNNILKITDNPAANPVSLLKYLDDTDKQNLSRNGYNLSIERGNTINIKPKLIAFRASSAGSGVPINAGASANLVFNNEKLDSVSVYNETTGEFKVPPGGEGLYQFSLVYEYSSAKQTLEIHVNGNFYEQVIITSPIGSYFVFPFFIYLTEDSRITIVAKTEAGSLVPTYPGPGIFSGYRVQ